VSNFNDKIFYQNCGIDQELNPAWKLFNDSLVETQPTCVPQKCEKFDTENNQGGVVECSDGFNFNTACDITCKDGYRKNGNSILTCEVRNDLMVWAGQLAQCEPIK
jgi:hypothetical protein